MARVCESQAFVFIRSLALTSVEALSNARVPMVVVVSDVVVKSEAPLSGLA